MRLHERRVIRQFSRSVCLCTLRSRVHPRRRPGAQGAGRGAQGGYIITSHLSLTSRVTHPWYVRQHRYHPRQCLRRPKALPLTRKSLSVSCGAFSECAPASPPLCGPFCVRAVQTSPCPRLSNSRQRYRSSSGSEGSPSSLGSYSASRAPWAAGNVSANAFNAALPARRWAQEGKTSLSLCSA